MDIGNWKLSQPQCKFSPPHPDIYSGMSISTNGFNPGSIGGFKGFDAESIGGGSDLLTQLEGRVSQTLAQKDDPAGSEMGMQAVNPQDVVSLMAEISSSPIAGTNFSSVV